MMALKIIRKIGKILRGGGGRKEIFLGMLCGVLIGFNPGASLTLLLALLLALLLNANMTFALLGAALGKILCLILSPLTFHTGYFLIHNCGLEPFFTYLVNEPFWALMDLNVYAQVGSLPYALIVGISTGAVLGTAVVRIREKMLEADQHEIIGMTFGNKVSRCLLRLAFGKSKLSLDEEVVQIAPLFRKSGMVLIGALLAVFLLLELLLLDTMVTRGLRKAISSATGAEVNVGKAHFSLGGGELAVKDLQITDPDKPTHNLFQIDTLTVDISIKDLLRRNYVISLLEGDRMLYDVPRTSPGEVYVKAKKAEEAEAPDTKQPGRPIDYYLADAGSWGRCGEKISDYLETRSTSTGDAEHIKASGLSKEDRLAAARQLGYLKASADLVADRPSWTIRRLKIQNVRLSDKFPMQTMEAQEICSHPELNDSKPTIFSLTSVEDTASHFKVILHLGAPDAAHELSVNLQDISLSDLPEIDSSLPVTIVGGTVDIKANGTFSSSGLQLPFTISASDLQTDVREGQDVMGMDAATAREVFDAIEDLDLEGKLIGTMASPRIEIDFEKLSENIRESLVVEGKRDLSKRAKAKMDQVQTELRQQATGELNKAMQSEEVEDIKSKSGEALKKLF